jgi:malonate transporter and related proteins
MLEILIIVLPVFIIMGVGYGAVATGYIKPEISVHLNAFTVKIAVPLLLFRAMYGLDFGRAFHVPMLVAFYLGAFASFTIAIILARLVWKRRPGEAIAVGFCAMFSNTVLLGLPILERAYGADAMPPGYGIVALHAPMLYAVGMTVMELSRRDGQPLQQTLLSALKSIFSNALMIGVLAGIIFNLVGIIVPDPLMAAVNLLAGAAIPAALIGIGAALTQYQLKAELSESLMVSVLSLAMHPLIAFVFARYIFMLDDEYIRVAVLFAAMPPGMNVYIFASMYNRAVAMSASTVLVANALSIGTITFWLALLNWLLP